MNTYPTYTSADRAIPAAQFRAKLEDLQLMDTAHLLRAIDKITRQMSEAEEKSHWCRHYDLRCLLDFAAEEMEARRNGYTGEIDS